MTSVLYHNFWGVPNFAGVAGLVLYNTQWDLFVVGARRALPKDGMSSKSAFFAEHFGQGTFGRGTPRPYEMRHKSGLRSNIV